MSYQRTILTLELLLILLPVFATWDCYNTKCVGTGQYRSTYINCNNRDHYCSTPWSGYPMCNAGFQLGHGVNCTDGFVCNWDSNTGVASCRPIWECYDEKCKGQGDYYSDMYMTCDNRYNYCDTYRDDSPKCVYTGKPSNRTGVNCTSGEYCTWVDYTGVVSCIEMNTTSWDCYDKKCKGRGAASSEYINCNYKNYHCDFWFGGSPKCVFTGYPSKIRNGVNCTSGENGCSWNDNTGVASCRAIWDCYDKKCQGQDDYSSKYINCDSEYNYCKTSSDGDPTCVYTGYPSNRTGVNCTSGEYCTWVDYYTGVVSCIETYWDCYDNKCNGWGDYSSKYINCDNEYNYCKTSSDGDPTCVFTGYPSNRTGVNCTSGENGCSWNDDTGVASCRAIWDCYDKKCQGQGYQYNSTYIYCENNSSYCTIYNVNGYPNCVYTGYPDNRTGVNCTGKQYCTQEDATGVAFCKDSKNSTITNSTIIVLTISLIIAFLVTAGCCYVIQKRRMYPNQAINLINAEESTTAGVVLDNRVAQQPAPHNMELTTAPPPDYTQQQNQLLQVQGIPDKPPPSYEQCVSNFDK